MLAEDAEAIVRAVFAAFETNDRSALERLIADDFHFSSPRDNRLDRATYLKRCWPASQTIQKVEFAHLIVDGEKVAATYEVTTPEGGRFRNTEVFTLRGQQVAEVEVYFGWNLPHPAAPGGFVD